MKMNNTSGLCLFMIHALYIWTVFSYINENNASQIFWMHILIIYSIFHILENYEITQIEEF